MSERRASRRQARLLQLLGGIVGITVGFLLVQALGGDTITAVIVMLVGMFVGERALPALHAALTARDGAHE